MGQLFVRALSGSLRVRGIAAQVFDLRNDQRKATPGPIRGTVLVDGGLFVDALPEELRTLPGFTPGMSQQEKEALAVRYDQRIPYAFGPQGPARPDGSRRFRGPALGGKLRCPNNEGSMSLGYDRPTTFCSDECACSKTVTLKQGLKERQANLYGTSKWLASYGRRVAVESVNAELKTHRGRLARGFVRVRGQHKNALLTGLALVGLNLRRLLDWCAQKSEEGRNVLEAAWDKFGELIAGLMGTGRRAFHQVLHDRRPERGNKKTS